MFDFQGHSVWPLGLGGDIILSLLPIVVFLFLRFLGLLPQIGRRTRLTDILIIFIFLLFIPNTLYSFFEIKHLIMADGIGDVLNLASYLVFGGISLAGLLSSIIISHLIVRHYAKRRFEIPLYLAVLGVANGIGVVLGLLNINSWDIFLPWRILKILPLLIANHFFVQPIILISLFFFTIVLCTYLLSSRY